MVRRGDKITLVNAFVRTFRGNMELNIGQDGRIVVLDRAPKKTPVRKPFG